jgi:hypothetical protein
VTQDKPWWERSDTPPEWWPFAPLRLARAAQQIAKASDELRWEDGEPINRPIDRRIWALWRRVYWSRYPALGLLPAPPTLSELDADLQACLSALAAMQAQAKHELVLDRLGRSVECLLRAREMWKQWDHLKDKPGAAGN